MIYLCIPAHNEETTIGVVLWKVRQIMAELPRDYQLLVADDGSTDRTAQALEPYTRVLPLTVMRTDEQRGYAASLEMLLREAVSRSDYPKRDAIVVLQADFTQDPGHLPNLVKRIESGADVVISEAVQAAGASRRDRLARSICLRLLRGIDWPEETHDPLTGYNAYRLFCVKRAIDKVDGARLFSWEGPLANAELLRATAPFARRIDNVELVMRPDRRQRATRARIMPALQGALAFRRGRRPEPGLTSDRLRPTRVTGAARGQRNLVVESLGEALTGDGAKSGRRRRPPDSGQSGGSERRRGRKAANGDDSKKEGRPQGKSRRRSGARRRKSPTSSEDGGADARKGRQAAPDTASASAEERSTGQADSSKSDGDGQAQRRRSRGRRGGRKRRRSGGGGGNKPSEPGPNDAREESAGSE